MAEILDFVYLNPKLHVDCNLDNNISLSNYYYNHYSNNYSLSNIPDNFNERVYLNNLSPIVLATISTLNNYIYNSMLLDGYTSNEIAPEFIPMINTDIYFIGQDTFSLPYFSTSNLSVGDHLYILENDYSYIYPKVVSIENNSVIKVSPFYYREYNNYKLLGIGFYNPLRTATISYLSFSNESIRFEYNNEFNPELYKLLYPESRFLDKENAYVNYLNNFPNRIGNVVELLRPSSDTRIEYDIVDIKTRLNLKYGSSLIFNGIKIDGISRNIPQSIDEFGFDYFVTERAAKVYTDTFVQNYDTFTGLSLSNYVYNLNSNLFFQGNNVYNLDVKGNNQIDNLYSKKIAAHDINEIELEIQIEYILSTISSTELTIIVNTTYDAVLQMIKIGEYIILDHVKYEIHSFNTNSITLRFNDPSHNLTINDINKNIFGKLLLLKNNISNKIYASTNIIRDSVLSYVYEINDVTNNMTDYLLINNTNVFQKGTGNNSYTDLSRDFNHVQNNLIFYKPIQTRYFQKEIKSKQFINEKSIELTTDLVEYEFNNFNKVIISNSRYNIERVTSSYQGYCTIVIHRTDGQDIGFDTENENGIVSGLLDNLTINVPCDFVFYDYQEKQESKDVITIDINSNVNIDNKVLFGDETTIIKGDIVICNDAFQIKKVNDGIFLSLGSITNNDKIYIGSSNIYVDSQGNLNTSGQIYTPYISTLPVEDNRNIITDLEKRVLELEAIVDKYNLFL